MAEKLINLIGKLSVVCYMCRADVLMANTLCNVELQIKPETLNPIIDQALIVVIRASKHMCICMYLAQGDESVLSDFCTVSFRLDKEIRQFARI